MKENFGTKWLRPEWKARTPLISIAVNWEYIKGGLGIKVWCKKILDQNRRQENFSPALLWTLNTSKLVLQSKCDGKISWTKMDEDQNGRRPEWKTTKMEDDQNGRRPKCKTTKIEDNQTGRRPKWKMTKMENDYDGRWPRLNTTKMKFFWVA